MAVDDEGVWKNPAFLGSGAPEIDVDPTAVSDYFAEVAGALFDTVTEGLGETPPSDGYMFRAKDAPGAWWVYVDSEWVMRGVPSFASTSDRDSALTSPAEGDLATSDGVTDKYVGSVWVVWDQGWTAWTPTLQNFNSLGTGGAASGQLCVTNAVCHFEGLIQFGTASVGALQNNRGFTLPGTPHATWDNVQRRIGEGLYRDASVSSAFSAGAIADMLVHWDPVAGYASLLQPYSGSSGVSDFGYMTGATSGLPTPAANDYISFRGSFPLAGAF